MNRSTTARLLSISLIVVTGLVACREQRREGGGKPGTRSAGPQSSATIVNIQTVFGPDEKVSNHQLTISGNQARLSDELDRWRLFDLDKKTVTLVDEISKSYVVYSYADLSSRQKKLIAGSLPPGIPTARFIRGSEQEMNGKRARQFIIQMGAYRRELWMPVEKILPANLFPLITVSEPLGEPFAPVMRDVMPQLLRLEGYPLLDKSEMSAGNDKFLIRKTVQNITSGSVSQSMFRVPAGYSDSGRAGAITRESAGDRPAASSRRSDQKTRGAG